MKTTTYIVNRFIVLNLMLFSLFAFSQTDGQLQEITSTYNKTFLKNFATQSLNRSVTEKARAIQYANTRNIPISYLTKEGSFTELQRVLPDGTLIYYQTNNADAAKSTRINYLNSGGLSNFNLDGQNMTSFVWDGGHPRVSHQEFDGVGGNNRVSIMDIADEGGVKLHYHAAHVVGTITASGVVPQAKGMAPQSFVKAYKWNNDLAEATLAASNGMLLSNHSYGFDISTVPTQWFGAYQIDSNEWDDLMFNAPYYLMVKSAGNDGTNNSANTSPLAPGYDKLSGAGTAKNNLVIANAKDAVIDNEGNLVSVGISASSSQGPTDDLRIKPDIAGNGVGLYSTTENSDTGYNTLSGTSMSAPNVTGALLLLQQHYNNENGSFMRAATLKGLALHTADDAGPVGPDAIWGWGLLNAKKAGETIIFNNYSSKIQELVISQGQTITLTVNSDGVNDLMASISWTDRPGAINYGNNSSTAALVNDLDIRIQKAANTYYPWRLTSATSNSSNGDNSKDPYERIDVKNASGTYTITISHKGTLVGGSQDFSLIVTGLEGICATASVPKNINSKEITGTTALISWRVIPGTEYDLRYRKQGSYGWMEVSNLSNPFYEITNLEPQTNYEFQVRSKCSGGVISEYSEMVNFSTNELTYCISKSQDDQLYISNVTLNTINNTSGKANYSDFTGMSTDLVAGQTYNIFLTSSSNFNNVNSYFAVYIDYNSNGSFSDPGEQVFSGFGFSDNVVTGAFTVPLSITPSTITMRVSTSNSGAPDPCETFFYGEVEDYTINLDIAHTDFIYENGVWTPNNPAGLSTSVDDIHVINGLANLPAYTSANNLKVNAGATLNVEKVLAIAGDVIIDGNLVFVSSANGNGELASVSGTSVISGNATVQRYMQNKRSYRMVSSAVNTTASIHANWQEGATSNAGNPTPGFGTHITGSTIDQVDGFDGTSTGNPSMFTVNVPTQEFVEIDNTVIDKLIAGNPYLIFVRGDRSIDLNNNNASSSTILRATGSLFTGPNTQDFPTAVQGNFVMFGNPYQSSVNMNSVFTNSTNLNSNHYYVYDPTLGDHGAYVTVNLLAPGTSPNQYLQPGQAAQAIVTGPGATIVFNESDKAPGNFTPTNRNTFAADDMLTVKLFTTENFNNNNSEHDRFSILFADGNNNAVTLMDAIKPMNFYENFGINNNGNYLSLEHRAFPQADEEISIYSTGYNHSDYTLQLNLEGLDGYVLSLIDTFTGSRTLLESGDNTYSFTIDPNNPLSIATDRFYISTEQRLGLNNNNLLAGIRLYPNPLNGDTFYINVPQLNGQQLSVSITDLIGRSIYKQNVACQENTIAVTLGDMIVSGVYMVTLKNGGESKTFKLIKK